MCVCVCVCVLNSSFCFSSVANPVLSGCQILYWNDTDLVNAQLDLPMKYYLGNLSEPIAVGARADSSGTTGIMTACLSAFYPPWTESFPASFAMWAGNTNANVSARAASLHLISQNFGVAGFVAVTPYALAYIAFPTIAKENIFHLADMINQNGDRVSAYPPNLAAGLTNPTFNSDLVTAQLIDSPAAGVWPIGGPTYVILRTGTGSTLPCTSQRELLLFWKWTITDPVAQARLSFDGYSTLGPAAHALVMNRLEAITCIDDGLSILANHSLVQHVPTAGMIGLLSAAEILGGIALIGIIAYLVLDWQKIPPPALFFFIAMLFGAVLNYISVGWFYLVPTHSYICQLRQWFVAIGFSVMFAAIFVRAFQIQSIILLSKSSKILSSKTRQVKSLIRLIGTFSIIVAVQLVLLIIWTSVDPWVPVHHQVDDLRATYTYICSSNNNWLWFGLEIAYYGILLVFGFIVVYRSWDLKHLVIESKYLAISVYNSAVIMIIVIILFATLPSNDNLVFYISAAAIGFLTTFSVIAFIGPKLLRISGSGSTSTGASEMSTSTHNTRRSKSKGSASLV